MSAQRKVSVVKMEEAFELRKTIRGTLPRVPFKELAADILGPNYNLSFVVTGDALMKRLNTEYRNKKCPTNVLSFPLSYNEGEIFLNLRKTEREAQIQKKTLKSHAAFLFIHACLHLKGHDHGPKMEALEKLALKKWGF